MDQEIKAMIAISIMVIITGLISWIIYLYDINRKLKNQQIVIPIPITDRKKMIILKTHHSIMRYEAEQARISMEDLIHHRIKSVVDKELLNSAQQFIVYEQKERSPDCIVVYGELVVYKKD